MYTQKEYAQRGWYNHICDSMVATEYRTNPRKALRFLAETLRDAPDWVTTKTKARFQATRTRLQKQADEQ